MTVFEHFIRAKKIKTLVVYRRKSVDKLFKEFIFSFKITKAAGGAVINEAQEVLMIHRHGRWDLPKGKKNRREKKKEAAIREVMEETGLKELKIKDKLSVTYHFYRRNRKLIIKKTHWYLMHARRDQEIAPATDEGIVKVKWTPFDKARKKSNKTFRSITGVIEKAINDAN